MVFEVQGKTDNFVRLQKDGKGIEFLGFSFLYFFEAFSFVTFKNSLFYLLFVIFL